MKPLLVIRKSDHKASKRTNYRDKSYNGSHSCFPKTDPVSFQVSYLDVHYTFSNSCLRWRTLLYGKIQPDNNDEYQIKDHHKSCTGVRGGIRGRTCKDHNTQYSANDKCDNQQDDQVNQIRPKPGPESRISSPRWLRNIYCSSDGLLEGLYCRNGCSAVFTEFAFRCIFPTIWTDDDSSHHL